MEKKTQTILEWYQEKHKFIDAPCNGKGDCGRCKIQFQSPAPEASEKDRRLLSREELDRGIRLACATEKTDREDFAPVDEGLWMEQEETASLGDTEESFGIALDIGTTTLAMRLVGLSTGKGYMTRNVINHQRTYGADVISRIQVANDGKLQELQSCIQQDILQLLEEMLVTAKVDAEKIKKIVIAANTTMCHLLLGYSCEGLGRAPFKPVSTALTKTSTRALFGQITTPKEHENEQSNLDAEVIILPGISAFVGADIVAGIYACDMDLKETPHMLLDIGTNGEMVLGDTSGFLVTSTAAGPVFEGGNISCGMPAVKGAISHIKGDQYEVIGGESPKGICGSGLVDLAAFLLEENLIDENGTLCDAYFDSGYLVFAGGENGIAEMDSDVRITQSDIRELQMGKAAIRAGMEVLIKEKLPEHIYLAGGFGTAIDVSSAQKIGLFASEQAAAISPRGNTALEGAHKFLLQQNGEERVNNIVLKAKEIVLAEDLNFEEKYIHFMQFLV